MKPGVILPGSGKAFRAGKQRPRPAADRIGQHLAVVVV